MYSLGCRSQGEEGSSFIASFLQVLSKGSKQVQRYNKAAGENREISTRPEFNPFALRVYGFWV